MDKENDTRPEAEWDAKRRDANGIHYGEDVRLERTEDLLERSLAEQWETNKLLTETNRLLTEFADSINQIGSMFSSPDGKPVSPTSMITKALFGR